ncbi:tyrosinase precursor, partial [Colletotrichum scovillei]
VPRRPQLSVGKRNLPSNVVVQVRNHVLRCKALDLSSQVPLDKSDGKRDLASNSLIFVTALLAVLARAVFVPAERGKGSDVSVVLHVQKRICAGRGIADEDIDNILVSDCQVAEIATGR